MARPPGLQHSAQKVRFVKMASPAGGACTARNKLRWIGLPNNQNNKNNKVVWATNNSDFPHCGAGIAIQWVSAYVIYGEIWGLTLLRIQESGANATADPHLKKT
jgi:hypothetical protein